MRLFKQQGFSLTEIIVAMVLILILAASITPAYRSYQIRSNRSDAIKSLLAIQMAEEQYRLNNSSYGTLAQIGSSTDSIEKYYTMSVSLGTNAYTITATARTAQSGDTGCTSMSLIYANGTTTNSPATCW